MPRISHNLWRSGGFAPSDCRTLKPKQDSRRWAQNCRVYGASAGALASIFGVTLVAGGVRVLSDPQMRPPRLPNRRPPHWVLPAAGALWCLAAGVLSAANSALSRPRLSAPRQGLVLKGATAVALTGLAVPGVAEIAFELVRRTVASRRPLPAETVVILGCALKGESPSDLLERRLTAALDVVSASMETAAGITGKTIDAFSVGDPCNAGDTDAVAVKPRVGESTVTVICSGGIGGDAHTDSTRAEGEVMVEWLAEQLDKAMMGTSASDPSELEMHSSHTVKLIAENAARNTVENIENSLRLIPADSRRVTVVTSDFHAVRVRRLLKAAGLDSWRVVGAHTPVKYWATSILREFLAQFVLWAPIGQG